jgi:hypothetical protein
MDCHAEPFASLKGKLREGSLSISNEMLRFAQHDNAGGWLVKLHNRASTHALRSRALNHFIHPRGTDSYTA